MTLAKLISTKRMSKKLSQQELAEKTNLSMSTISKIEQGVITNPDIDTAHALALALDIPMGKISDIIVENNY